MLPGMMPTTFIPEVAGGIGGNDSFTKFLIHCDGADASTTFTDVSGSAHTVTVSSNAQVDTAQSKFGGASLLLNETSDYLSLASSSDWAFGTSTDFTIDFWIRPTAFGANNGAFAINGVCTFQMDATSRIQLFHAANGFSAPYLVSSAMSTATWHHLAMVRSGSTTKLYVDGTEAASTGASMNWTAGTFYIGTTHFDPAGGSISAHIDEFRISNGVARWTSAFTPPTGEYT